MKKKCRRTVCFFTGARSEFGLLKELIREFYKHRDVDVRLVVSGMHMSDEFGLTYREIESENIKIDKTIEMLLSSDTPAGIVKSIGMAQICFSEALKEVNPHVVVLLGDRFETFAFASAALVFNIPIVHIHGGELTEGAFDDALRHSITKMSKLHFTSTEEYRKRVIQLGEAPETVFNVGAIGLDSISGMRLATKKEFESQIGRRLDRRSILVTFHPVTLESDRGYGQFKELLKAIDNLRDTTVIFTMPNADSGGRAMIRMIEEYVSANPDKAIAFDSLGRMLYISALKHVDAVVGNSSSGIIEAPSLKVGTINIGDRQRGRVTAASVINCRPDEKSIMQAFRKLYSKDFQSLLKNISNPYESEGTVKAIAEKIIGTDFTGCIKKFYDLNN